MALNANIQVRIDEKDKAEADALFSSLGVETSTAIRMFLKKAIKVKGFPFDVNDFSYLIPEDEQKIDGVPVWNNKNGETCVYYEDYIHFKKGIQLREDKGKSIDEFYAWCENNGIVAKG